MVVWPWRRKKRTRSAGGGEPHEPPRWVELGWYAGLFAADVDRALLESAGIPVLVKSSATGLFGPGFSGATTEGVRLYVPSRRLEDARSLLAGEGTAE